MQITETLSEGLKREIQIVVPASDLGSKLETRLAELKDKVRLNGFRPGKVPINHLRKVYGKSVMAEIVEQTINETGQQALKDRDEKSATTPQFDLTEDEQEAMTVLDGKADLSFKMTYEVMPDFEVGDTKSIKIERPVVDVPDEEVMAEVERIGASARTFDEKDGAAEDGDQVKFDFVGRIDGETFEGGSAEDFDLVLGSGQFIPGFEEQLVGVKAGDEKTVGVPFPEDYQVADLAGKDAEFTCTIKHVYSPNELVLDDEFAKKFGMETVDQLKDAVRGQIESQYGSLTRQRVKRQLLDQLDEMHKFDVPPTLYDQELRQIWIGMKQQEARENPEAAEAAEGADAEENPAEQEISEEAKTEYGPIAERRVRLGLVLSAIGEEAKVEVTDEEVQRAVYAQARNFPGQEQQIVEVYAKNPNLLASVRAPIFEEKVVDYLLELAEVTDKTVTKEELEKLVEDDEDEN